MCFESCRKYLQFYKKKKNGSTFYYLLLLYYYVNMQYIFRLYAYNMSYILREQICMKCFKIINCILFCNLTNTYFGRSVKYIFGTKFHTYFHQIYEAEPKYKQQYNLTRQIIIHIPTQQHHSYLLNINLILC